MKAIAIAIIAFIFLVLTLTVLITLFYKGHNGEHHQKKIHVKSTTMDHSRVPPAEQ